jgi:hypothetical protein
VIVGTMLVTAVIAVWAVATASAAVLATVSVVLLTTLVTVSTTGAATLVVADVEVSVIGCAAVTGSDTVGAEATGLSAWG